VKQRTEYPSYNLELPPLCRARAGMTNSNEADFMPAVTGVFIFSMVAAYISIIKPTSLKMKIHKFNYIN